jgi:GNAT superfamily N-acetyltransferase
MITPTATSDRSADKWRFRAARLEDAPLLTALKCRSKAHWGYDAEFMSQFAADHPVTEALIATVRYEVAEDQTGTICGYFSLEWNHDVLILDDLFVEPVVIGTGCGKALFLRAVATARDMGATAFSFDADPNAEGFYAHLGCQVVGRRESVIAGRFIPDMYYRFPTVPQQDHSRKGGGMDD